MKWSITSHYRSFQIIAQNQSKIKHEGGIVTNRIERIAQMMGERIRYDKYRMWHHVPYIKNTAIVCDEVVEKGGQAIILPRDFPASITDAYIVSAIKDDAISLGEYTLNDFKLSFKDYKSCGIPNGYETHKIGKDSRQRNLVDRLMAM